MLNFKSLNTTLYGRQSLLQYSFFFQIMQQQSSQQFEQKRKLLQKGPVSILTRAKKHDANNSK